MIHLLVSREYPPAPGGGIGTYVMHMACALADAGETVHVIGQRWAGAETPREALQDGRLVIHRLPFNGPDALFGIRPHRALPAGVPSDLFRSSAPAQAFAWQVAELVERLVLEEGIDVIEGPDYEAPLGLLQLRRAVGVGPTKKPPCVVHLHSPTEFIARANGWDPASALRHTSERLESYSILSADALLCPSRYLANQVEARYALSPGAVEVIPYPLGRSSVLARTPETWASGSVLYLGRLEPRKGIFEWLMAAIDVAGEHPDIRFDFVGADHTDAALGAGSSDIRSRIPAELRSRFTFHGHRDRDAVRQLLAGARLVVVPSRWENFPYTCIEAMASGVPVIASPEGGMAEMIVDGRTGWVAESARPADLARATLAALKSGADGLERAGAEAAVTIRRMCDDRIVVARHLEFVERVVRSGSGPSLQLSRHLPRRGRPDDEVRAARITPAMPANRHGEIACVIVAGGSAADAASTRRSLETQTAPVAGGTAATIPDTAAARNDWLRGLGVLPADAVPVQVGLPLAAAFVPAGTRVEPEFLDRCREVLRRHPRVGIVSCWHRQGDSAGPLAAPPCPAFPYQWVRNDVAAFAVIRAEAIRDAGGYREDVEPGWEHWDLVNAVMAAGWVGVAFPEVLVRVPARAAIVSTAILRSETLRRRLRDRFPDEAAHDAHELRSIEESVRRGTDAGAAPEYRLGHAIRVGMRQPLRTAHQLARRLARRLLGVSR